jgi:hypothetical protein
MGWNGFSRGGTDSRGSDVSKLIWARGTLKSAASEVTCFGFAFTAATRWKSPHYRSTESSWLCVGRNEWLLFAKEKHRADLLSMYDIGNMVSTD